MGWVKTEKTNKLSKLGDIDFTTTAPVDGNALVYDETNDVWIPGEGGGSSGVELTQAEYDQLTQEEKNNGTIYQISDRGYFYYKEKQFRAVKELTQAQYDTLTPTQKADGTIYMISDATNNLDDLDNVNISNLTDGQIIEYDSTTQTWVNATNNIANKMDKVNPTGTGSLSLNRKAGTTVGTNSVAIGNNNTASSSQSYAEGSNNVSSSINSHAEGSGNTASGIDAHVEGSGNTASGVRSHAEGYGTTATAPYSHAEGTSTQAKGDASHAEGSSTHAEGYQSHAEGNMCWALGSNSHAEGYKTRATHKSQHVCGEWNTLDPSTATSSNRGNYVEIVGNGNAENSRSNARTLDWSGNETLAGDIIINGNQSVTQALSKIVVQKTQAEYDLLTSTEKNNGSIYKITDKAKIYCLDEEYHAIKEITSANYAQLTNTEKNNGTLYVITDKETTADDIPYSSGVSVADKLDSLSYTITNSTDSSGVNWTVKKYNNGDMEIWVNKNYTPSQSIPFTGWGSMYYVQFDSLGSYPEAFYSMPCVMGQVQIDAINTISSITGPSDKSSAPRVIAVTYNAATIATKYNIHISIYAKGRWKA